MTEWNYFSSLISQEKVDYEKINLYLNVLSPSSTPTINRSMSQLKDEKRTSSGIFQKDTVSTDSTEFSLNRTLGNYDRIKFTGLLPAKSNNTFVLDPRDKKTKISKPSFSVQNLIDSM